MASGRKDTGMCYFDIPLVYHGRPLNAPNSFLLLQSGPFVVDACLKVALLQVQDLSDRGRTSRHALNFAGHLDCVLALFLVHCTVAIQFSRAL